MGAGAVARVARMGAGTPVVPAQPPAGEYVA
jgi:hypothetical protein